MFVILSGSVNILKLSLLGCSYWLLANQILFLYLFLLLWAALFISLSLLVRDRVSCHSPGNRGLNIVPSGLARSGFSAGFSNNWDQNRSISFHILSRLGLDCGPPMNHSLEFSWTG